jgi:hypothetical protein
VSAPRCHLHLPITDSAGVVYPYASISFNNPATGLPTSEPIYVQPTGGNPISQPLFADPAVIEVWTNNPIRLQIVATIGNSVRIQLDGVDLLPEPTTIVQTVDPLLITGADTIAVNAALMTSLPGEAAFRVSNPVATHQHQGDSVGSVVLTGEDATDYNPFQTWMGYHAGENTAANTTGSTALGPHAIVQGASATIAGIGQVTYNPATGLPGDSATVLSSEDGTATAGSTTIGAANLAKQGLNMTLVGSLNGPTSTLSTPDGAVAVGPGNVVGAAGSVKVGPNHPTSTAGSNHTAIGSGNVAQANGLPWAGPQTPAAVGSSTTLAGDPSSALSSTDWFGGVGPLALGVNSTAFSPSLTSLSGQAATQTLLKVSGDVVVNGQRTYSNSSTTLGYYGATGVVRPQVSYNPGDVVNAQLAALCQVLARMGLIYTTDVPVLTESGTHANGTLLEFAETGQALQWKLPPTSPAYLAANPFTVASNKVVLNAANGPYATHGVAAIYSAGISDASVQGRFGYSSATSGFPASDLYTGLMVRSYNAQTLVGGQPQAVVTGYLVGRSAVYLMADNTVTSTVATLSSSPAAGDLLQADCIGTSVTIRVNGTAVATFTDSTLNTKVKHGFRITGTGAAYGLQVYPFGF